MTFAYVGYIWAILGCCAMTMFLAGIALTLTLIGRRTDRNHPRTVVDTVAIGGEPPPPPSDPDAS